MMFGANWNLIRRNAARHNVLEGLDTDGNKQVFSFPPSWVDVSNVATELVVCKMEMKEESIAVVTFWVIEDLR